MAELTNHHGQLRAALGLSTNSKRGMDEELPRLNIMSNALLRKKLQNLVYQCPYRQDMGQAPNSCCSEKRTYRCNLYNIQQVKMYDCMVCQKNKAIKEKAEWIKPFVQLCQGLVSSSLSLDQALRLLGEQ